MGLWNVSELHCLETVHGAVSPLTASKLPPASAHDHHADDGRTEDDRADDGNNAAETMNCKT